MELLDFAFSGVNIVPTVLLLFCLIYWIIVIIGVVDIDTVDIDLDLDMDADADIDVDADMEIGGLASVLSFFNIGHMPLMIFITFFSLPLWVMTLITNDKLQNSNLFLGIAVLLAATVISLFVAKFLTTPIAKFYRRIKKETEAIKNIVGKVCRATLPIGANKVSQAEVNVEGTSVLINVKASEGITINKGDEALVVSFDEAKNQYLVEPY